MIIRPGAIGDFIVALPAMEMLRSDYTEVWTAGVNVPLARFADRARSIVATGLDRLGVVDADDVMEELRSFDSIVSWYGTNRDEFRESIAELGLPFVFHAALPGGGGMHAVDFFLSQVGGNAGGAPRIEIPDSPREEFAVLHPFSGSARKNWPMERFEELAERLERRMRVVWCRGPEDRLEGAVCIPDLYDLACWLGTARVFIGNDSGVSHLAAAVGTPVVAVFGPSSDARVWAPRGANVRVIARAGVAVEMADTMAEEVEQAIT